MWNFKDREIDVASGSPRFPRWLWMTLCSTISLIALASGSHSWKERHEAWSLSAVILSLALGVLSSVAHHVLDKTFVGSKWEGFMILIVLAMWAGSLPIIMKPEHNLALSEALISTMGNDGETTSKITTTSIVNANLFFFSWASFGTALLIATHYVEEVLHHYVLLQELLTEPWAALCACSVIAMSSSSQLFQLHNCEDNRLDEDQFCIRIKFAVGLGAWSTVFSGIMLLLILCGKGGSSSVMVDMPPSQQESEPERRITDSRQETENPNNGTCDQDHNAPMTIWHWIFASVSLVLFVAWCMGLVVFTFGDNGPATSIGNLFFGAWGAFLISAYLSLTYLRTVCWRRTTAATNSNPQNGRDGDTEEGESSGSDAEQPSSTSAAPPIFPSTAPPIFPSAAPPIFPTTSYLYNKPASIEPVAPRKIVMDDNGNKIQAMPPEQPSQPGPVPPRRKPASFGSMKRALSASRRRLQLPPIEEEDEIELGLSSDKNQGQKQEADIEVPSDPSDFGGGNEEQKEQEASPTEGSLTATPSPHTQHNNADQVKKAPPSSTSVVDKPLSTIATDPTLLSPIKDNEELPSQSPCRGSALEEGATRSPSLEPEGDKPDWADGDDRDGDNDGDDWLEGENISV